MVEVAQVEDLVQLVLAAQAGDAGAFETLVRRYQDFAYAAAFARVGDRQLAQDVAQEAFLQAHRDLRSLREPRAFSAWLGRLVAKHSDRLLRRRGWGPWLGSSLSSSLRKRPITFPLDAALETCDEQPQPAEVAEASELAELVRAEVNRLPERERLAIALYYVADRPQSEIAAFLGVPPSTIKKRLHDARRRLKERLMSQFGEHLREFRPSQDDRFADRLKFLIAVRTGAVARVQRHLASDPSLLEATLAGEDWGRAEMGQPTLPLEFDYTPLLFAANYGQHDLAEVLLRRGANPNVHVRGETPLGRAVLMHDQAMVNLLLRGGADANTVLLNGITPLHRAAMRGHAALAGRLLDAGADPAARDAFGRTPRDWAVLDGRPEVATLLGAPVPEWSDAAAPPAPGSVLETGIKVIDVMTPLPRGGAIRTTAQGGVGKMVLLAELVHRLARQGGRAVYVRWYERFYRPEDASREQMEAGVDGVSELVLGHMDLADRERTLRRGIERAEALRDEHPGRDVLMLVDAPPEGDLPLESVRERIGVDGRGSITLLVFDLLLPNTGYARPAVDDTEWDVQLVFDRRVARRGIYPAVDAVDSRSRLLTDGRVSHEHATLAREVRSLLSGAGDSPLDARAQRAIEFQSQPFFTAEPWTARPGAWVPLNAALAGYRAITGGAADALSEGALLWAGAFPSAPV